MDLKMIYKRNIAGASKSSGMREIMELGEFLNRGALKTDERCIPRTLINVHYDLRLCRRVHATSSFAFPSLRKRMWRQKHTAGRKGSC
eukprot:336025-Pelagomonas_calceolata.AAC.7